VLTTLVLVAVWIWIIAAVLVSVRPQDLRRWLSPARWHRPRPRAALRRWWHAPDRTLRILKLTGQAALLAWFAYWAWRACGDNFLPGHRETIGIDGRLYWRAAHAWVTGADPWQAFTTTNTWPPSDTLIRFYFTGPPPTVIAFAPMALIPEESFVWGWMALTIVAAIYTLRRLHLPVWWLLFPPLAQGIVVANPHVVCLALLLAGSNWLGALAAPVKAYAVFPLLGEKRLRALFILAVAVAVSVIVFWPLWSQYRSDYNSVETWLMAAMHGGFSAARDPRLFVATAVAIGLLALIDRKAAGWLAVPALWPASQYFYSSFALPVINPILAFGLPAATHRRDAWIAYTIIAYVAWRLTCWAWPRVRARLKPTPRRSAQAGELDPAHSPTASSR
jgi:hypothetical protein